MGDSVVFDNGDLEDATISSVEAASGHVQRVKLTYSADNSDTHVLADASGLKVQLGAALPAGTAEIGKLAANSGVDIGDVTLNAGTAEIGKLAAGSAEIGRVEISDGTTQAEVTATGTNKGLYTSILDQDGVPLSFALPLPASVGPTMDAATYEAGDSLLDAAFSIANATTGAGRTNHLLGLRIIDKDDQGIDLTIYFFRSAPSTIAAAQDAFTLDDTDSAKVCGFIDTSTDGVWDDLGGSKFWQMTRSPIPMLATATTQYLLCKTQGAPTYTASGLIIEPTLARD